MPDDSDTPFDPSRPELTSAQTDTEAGNEHLDPDEDRAKSIEALKAMYARGLIGESEYKKRLKELKKT